ncbi:phosphoserine phosphatase SerB [Leptonema illini]|uniref:Phosphoserine phosphatase n=1 Tax=Leptonema illini DSM 21528 TaxID=929563 RepID=H2CFE3_9LEPT|nr:phosphoserine phosphatase SerB [Leptonema illini]EHQ07768.1 phosphoserine phosphatase SerB [Leptonema illini DSM 21528]
MSTIVLVNVSGPDRAGITRSVTEILGRYGVRVLDIGQAVIHNHLSLGLLIQIPPESESAPVLKDLLFRTHEMGLQLKFTPISEDDYELWVNAQGKERYIITALSRSITAEQIHQLTTIISENGLNIQGITRLSGRFSLRHPPERPRAGVEFQVRGEPADAAAMRLAFLALAQDLGMDVSFQKDDRYRRNRRLVCFDMDSTLIQAEVIDELAREAGVGEQVVAITESAMRGEIDFNESFRRRVALLKGLSESRLDSIVERISLTEGAEELIRALKGMGLKTAILSGGFTFFGRRLQQRLGIDYLHANELVIENGVVTGEVREPIVNGQRKADLLKQIAEQEGIRLEQVIAVGDGANDLPMIGLAGLGIAFQAKPLVRKSASHAISNLGLDGILYLLGVRDRDV